MAKDYGRNRSSQHRGKGFKQFLLVLLSFLVGYLTASVFDIGSLTHWVNTHFLAAKSNKKQDLAMHASKLEALPKPKFEFYTLLPKEKTAVPAQALASATTLPEVKMETLANATASVAPAPSTPLAEKGSYGLQVGSFKTRQEAERMKADLILKGFTVTIALVTQGQEAWHRVIIGPYSNPMEAKQVQAAFSRSQHVLGMIRKMDV